jgi:hypothetical protein
MGFHINCRSTQAFLGGCRAQQVTKAVFPRYKPLRAGFTTNWSFKGKKDASQNVVENTMENLSWAKWQP